MTIDLSRAHSNNPFRQPEFIAADEWLRQGSLGISGSRWLGFGPAPHHVDTQVAHYQGAKYANWQMSPADADVVRRLNAMNDGSWSSRGYALYYGFDVPVDGRLWGIRAFDWRNAANADDDKSDGNENDWTYAVHTVVQKLYPDNSDTTVEPTWDQLETHRWLRWEAREYAVEATGDTTFQIDMLGHRQIKPTGCPGDKFFAAIMRGDLNIPDRTADTPQIPDPPSDPEDNMAKRTLYIPTDCDAQFLGWGDDDGNAIEVVWVTKAVADAHRSVGVVIRDQLSSGGFVNCVLLGPLPQGDTRKAWADTDFFRVVS